LKKGEEMTWVDVGGGTARVLEYFDAATIRKYFKKIFIIDVSSSLLDVARERIRNMKLEGIVQVIEEDFTSVGALSAIPIPLHTVDIITFSYSLSMIAKQAAAIENSSKLLKRKYHTRHGGKVYLKLIEIF
jgi:betaine lipid synthase